MSQLTDEQRKQFAEDIVKEKTDHFINLCKKMVDNPPKSNTNLRMKLEEMEKSINHIQGAMKTLERWLGR